MLDRKLQRMCRQSSEVIGRPSEGERPDDCGPLENTKEGFY